MVEGHRAIGLFLGALDEIGAPGYVAIGQFARLLDFYGIEWAYEPRAFDLEWDGEGRVTQRFTPDFYLPAYDLYIEITTLNQKLVTKKNRKVRRLRERYPGVHVKVFYQRDYRTLAAKYGLAALGSPEVGGAA
mgnify:CR=1 FL=1